MRVGPTPAGWETGGTPHSCLQGGFVRDSKAAFLPSLRRHNTIHISRCARHTANTCAARGVPPGNLLCGLGCARSGAGSRLKPTSWPQARSRHLSGWKRYLNGSVRRQASWHRSASSREFIRQALVAWKKWKTSLTASRLTCTWPWELCGLCWRMGCWQASSSLLAKEARPAPLCDVLTP